MLVVFLRLKFVWWMVVLLVEKIVRLVLFCGEICMVLMFEVNRIGWSLGVIGWVKGVEFNVCIVVLILF